MRSPERAVVSTSSKYSSTLSPWSVLPPLNGVILISVDILLVSFAVPPLVRIGDGVCMLDFSLREKEGGGKKKPQKKKTERVEMISRSRK